MTATTTVRQTAAGSTPALGNPGGPGCADEDTAYAVDSGLVFRVCELAEIGCWAVQGTGNIRIGRPFRDREECREFLRRLAEESGWTACTERSDGGEIV